MSKAHYILIMICIITISLTWSYYLTQENKRLDIYNSCMEFRLSTDSTECSFCDSISKLKSNYLIMPTPIFQDDEIVVFEKIIKQETK